MTSLFSRMFKAKGRLFACVLGLSLGPSLLLAGGPGAAAPIQTHDALTRKWRPSDYKPLAASGITCGLCFGENLAGITTEGCEKHFAEDNKGICRTCLFQPDAIPYFLKEGVYHDHTLPDGTEHRCLVTAGSLLAYFSESGVLARIDELRRLRTTCPGLFTDPDAYSNVLAERREVAKKLKNTQVRSAVRTLRQRLRSLDWKAQKLRHHRQLAGAEEWITELRSKYEAQAGHREELAMLDGLCTDCGGYPTGKRRDVEALSSMKGVLWAHLCPACVSTATLRNTGTCSVITCNSCLELSGEATRYCVVCRKTTRGEATLFPGKAGFEHSRCVETMRKLASDPAQAGSFDLCSCAVPEDED